MKTLNDLVIELQNANEDIQAFKREQKETIDHPECYDEEGIERIQKLLSEAIQKRLNLLAEYHTFCFYEYEPYSKVWAAKLSLSDYYEDGEEIAA